MRLIKLQGLGEGNTFEDRVANSINNIVIQNIDYDILKLSFFVNSLSKDQYKQDIDTIQNVVSNYFKANIPAVSIVALPCSNDKELLIESLLHPKNIGKVEYKKIFGHHYSIVEYNNSTELFSGSIRFSENDELYRAQKTLDFAEQILDAEELTFDALYKQNNYFGRISKDRVSKFKEIQNFYYGESNFEDRKPLNSYLGTNYDDLVIDISAIHYGDAEIGHQTIGNTKLINSCDQKAIIVRNSNKSDIELQTLDILQNIFSDLELLKTNNRLLLHQNSSLKNSFELIKVFMKNETDTEIVSSNLKVTFPDTPILIFYSEFSNTNQLIEIEATLSLK